MTLYSGSSLRSVSAKSSLQQILVLRVLRVRIATHSDRFLSFAHHMTYCVLVRLYDGLR